jgi:uncharacterized Tic20 family protein
VSDAEREPVVEILRQAFAEGRLTKDEFDERLAFALTARTHAELAPVLTGLVVPRRGDEPPEADERAAAALAHLLGAATSFVGPLIMVVATRNARTGFARGQAVEALNYQLSLLIITCVTLGIGALLYLVSWIFCIAAAVNTGTGRPFRYPFTIRLVR